MEYIVVYYPHIIPTAPLIEVDPNYSLLKIQSYKLVFGTVKEVELLNNASTVGQIWPRARQ